MAQATDSAARAAAGPASVSRPSHGHCGLPIYDTGITVTVTWLHALTGRSGLGGNDGEADPVTEET